tara:strand:- start:188 stop:598 length:411 start_codon:yes stop_codon:yes gene_type:complete
MRKPGLVIPPENYLELCRPEEEIKIAQGVIIKNKYGVVTRRGGPETLGTQKGDLTEKPRVILRNRFQPTRQGYSRAYISNSRITDDERAKAKADDIARNGSLVQVSNKTLDKVFDKFGLLTMSDEILDMIRTGKMS